MGCYTYLTEDEFRRFVWVEDAEVNSVFQEVRRINPVWYINQTTHIKERWFRKPTVETRFDVYEVFEYPTGNFSKPEVRVQMSCNTKANVLNFLYGLNIGYHFKNP